MSGPPTYPTAGAISGCGSVPLDAEYFLNLFDRTFPFEYLFPLKVNSNSGYELFQATAAMGERVSTAIFRLECGLLTMVAPTGAKATVTVTFTRPNAAAGAVTIDQNTVVTTSKGDRRFIIDSPVVFGASDVGPHTVTATAQATGYEYNVRGQRIAKSGEVLPGEIDTIYALNTTPIYGDTTFVVTQIPDATGGTDAALEALGADRGVFRNANESEQLFRYRVRSLPDTVSPAAIKRTVRSLLGSSDFCFREVGQPGLRGMYFDGDDVTGDVNKIDFYDVDSLAFDGVVTSGTFQQDERVELRNGLDIIAQGYFGSLEISNTRFWMIRIDGTADLTGSPIIVGLRSGAIFTPSSAPSVQPAVNNRRFRLMLDYVEFRAFFLIGLPRSNAGEFGMAFDVGPRNAFDYATTVAAVGTQNFFDGFPVIAFRLYTSIYDGVAKVKAGGVGFDIYIEDIGCP